MKKIKVPLTITTIISLSILVGFLWTVRDSAEWPEIIVPGSIVPVSLDDYPLGKKQRNRWTLPKGLHEVSGVAVVDTDRIFMHNDESAVVYEFEIGTQEVTRRFQLGDPSLKLDLEGIATINSDVYLVVSTGHIYKIADGMNRRGVIDDYEVYDSGLEQECEVEGLEEDFEGGALVLVCKQVYGEESDYISVYQYKPGEDQALKLFDLSFETLGGKFHPSAISKKFGSYIILAGREHRILQVSPQGDVITVAKLKKKHHKQAEGIGFLPDGRLIIADEGKDRKGRITAYQPARNGTLR